MGNCGGKKEEPKGKNGRKAHTRTSEELRKDAPQLEVDVPEYAGVKVEVHLYNAFIREGVEKGKDTGNPAGVVMLKQVEGYDLKELDDDVLLDIAKQVGLSETAFCKFGAGGDGCEIAFFTPKKQVNLCAHATVAAWSHMFDDGIINNGAYAMHTKAGTQAINVWKNGTIRMTQEITKYSAKGGDPKRKEVAKALGITVDDLKPEGGWPIRVGSSGGTWKLIVCVKNQEILDNLKPDFKKIQKISETHGAVGFYVVNFLGGRAPKPIAKCRNFAPVVGIEEDAATGTSASTAAAYLFAHGKLGVSDGDGCVFEQGDHIDRPSSITVYFKVDASGKKLTELAVSGMATSYDKKTITL